MQLNVFLRRGFCAGVVSVSAVVLSACASSGSPRAGNAPEMDPSQEHIINHEVSAADLAAAKSKSALQADKAVLWVNGMGCPLCASNIDKQLARLSGVSSVKVDLGEGKVWLGMKPGAPHPSPARLGEAVEDAGFTLVKVETPAP